MIRSSLVSSMARSRDIAMEETCVASASGLGWVGSNTKERTQVPVCEWQWQWQ